MTWEKKNVTAPIVDIPKYLVYLIYLRYKEMTKSVKVDDEDYSYVVKQAKYGESFAKVLKRLLKR